MKSEESLKIICYITINVTAKPYIFQDCIFMDIHTCM